MNPNYQRAPVPPPRYGAAVRPGVGPPFPGPFNRPGIPLPFQNLVSYPISIPPPGFQRFSTEPSYQAAAQLPAGWTRQQDELQNLEVTKKAEEFLRMLETKDWSKLPSQSGDKSMKGSSADGQPERHTRGRSRSRSWSRGRSRGRSRAKSRAQSRARSREKSRARSRSREKSRSRAKSRPRSRSRGRSLARSKSQPRFCNVSQSSILNTEVPSVRVPELIQNLKQIIKSKELEKQQSVMKDPFKNKQETAAPHKVPEFLRKPQDPVNSVLPHERVSGSDSTSLTLSWNDLAPNPETFPSKCVLASVEDEEEFLYGEDGRKKPQAVTVPLAQTRPAENPIPITTSRRPVAPDVSAEECERVRNLLKTIGLNLNRADISKLAARLKQKQEEQREASTSTTLRTTLETLLNRSKVQKSDDCRSNRSESSQLHHESDHRESKKREREKECREKQIQKKRKEYLVKELEDLLKHEGSGDLIPVIGFFCQRCEEFFGDLKSAEEHKHTNTTQQLRPTVKQEQNPERKRPRQDPHSTKDREKKVEEDDTHSSKSNKKKKKKQKKKKKKVKQKS